LRLTQVPFDAVGADGKPLVLLRVETEALADVGASTLRWQMSCAQGPSP
jgi:hypothetical protein